MLGAWWAMTRGDFRARRARPAVSPAPRYWGPGHWPASSAARRGPRPVGRGPRPRRRPRVRSCWRCRRSRARIHRAKMRLSSGWLASQSVSRSISRSRSGSSAGCSRLPRLTHHPQGGTGEAGPQALPRHGDTRPEPGRSGCRQVFTAPQPKTPAWEKASTEK